METVCPQNLRERQRAHYNSAAKWIRLLKASLTSLFCQSSVAAVALSEDRYISYLGQLFRCLSISLVPTTSEAVCGAECAA